MSEAVIQLPTRRGARAAPLRDAHRDTPDAGACVVECCPFPRVSATRGWRVGVARERSATGLRLELDASQPVGSLLRIVLRGIDGGSTLDALGRVTACTEGAERVRLDVALVETAPGTEAEAPRPSLARVRPPAPRRSRRQLA